MPDVIELQAAIDKLPKTAIGINFYLRRNHIDGFTAAPAVCPLANYFKEEGIVDPYVETNRVESGRLSAPSTPGMKRFIKAFDKGRFGFRGLETKV